MTRCVGPTLLGDVVGDGVVEGKGVQGQGWGGVGVQHMSECVYGRSARHLHKDVAKLSTTQ